ncbi:MAG: hypothetical protein Tsb0020_15770 [Haliangiales bacterium]
MPDAEPVDMTPDAAPAMPTLVLSATAISVAEGDAAGASFGVTLSEAPGRDVAVTVTASDDTLVTLSETGFTFADDNFDTSHDFTVVAADDADSADETVTITVAADGIDSVEVTVTIVDDEAVNIVATPTDVTIDEGGTGTVAVSLSAQPEADVTVAVASSDDAAVSADTASLTFTPDNYDTAQTITLSAAQDDDTVDGGATVTLSATDLSDVTVTVTVADDDVLTILTDPATLALDEGAGGSFDVTLSHDPGGDFEVTLESGDEGAVTITPTSLTFSSANFGDPQTVTVNALADADADDESVTVTATAASDATITTDVTVTVTDPTPAIVLNVTDVTISPFTGPGSEAPILVTLSQDPAAAVTVSFSMSDEAVAVAAAPGSSGDSVTFNPGEFDTPKVVNVIGLTLGTALLTFTAPGHASAVVVVNVVAP